MTRSAELIARVLAEPADDELRKVLADALVEEGDPRGELIHLQYARLEGRGTAEHAEREKQILERHGADLLGPLIAVVGSYEIERGFLRKCDVPWHRQSYNIERAVGHELWATVEELAGPALIHLHPVMRSLISLRTANEVATQSLAELCGGSIERPLQRLEISNSSHKDLPDILFESPALPDLRELYLWALREPRDLDRLAGTPIAKRLDRLSTRGGRYQLEQWHDATIRNRPARSVALLDVIGGQFTFALDFYEREGRYDSVRLTARASRWAYAAPFSLASLRGRIQRVDLEIIGAAPPEAVSHLQAEAKSFPESSCVVRES